MVTAGADRIWTYADFAGLEMGAVSQTLSRLAKEGIIRRVRKGVYYRPRQTVIGESQVSSAALGSKLLASGARPTGLTAAQTLGLTTQVPSEPSFAISRNNAPSNLPGIRVKVRRPATSEQIDIREAATLELLRDRGETSEFSSEETIWRLAKMLKEPSVFDRLAEAAVNEPPRVRAILGALGQEAGVHDTSLERLRKSLNKLSRFNFGHLKSLRFAKEWQSK
jgi:Mn-dependent DtxR family transcriptional regulator